MTSNMTKKLLLEENSIWSGMEGLLIKEGLAEILNLPQSAGILVQRVANNSLIQRMGIKAGFISATIDDHELLLGGDIILEIQNISISGTNVYPDIRKMILNLKKGDEITIKILRAGKTHQLSTYLLKD